MLSTSVGVIQMETPLLLASGRITETPDFFFLAQPFGCAGMITRSLRENVPSERMNVPAPRYHIIDRETLLNCEWSNENHWSYWRNIWTDSVKKSGGNIIISLSGRDIESCIHLIKSFDEVGVDAYEINISCSHSGAIHGNLNTDMDWLKKILGGIRPITTTPIWIKLSYSHSLIEMARIAEALGADAIVCTNTIGPGLILDIESGKSVLGIEGGAGGVSGRAIFPIALRCVYELYNNVSIPIVGVGGISSTSDTIQMLMAGASAVQLYTAPSLIGPEVFKEIITGLNKYIDNHDQFKSLKDIVGFAHSHKNKHHQLVAPIPEWHHEKCTFCGNCLKACHFNAISIIDFNRVEIDRSCCVSCTACVGMCPRRALRV